MGETYPRITKRFRAAVLQVLGSHSKDDPTEEVLLWQGEISTNDWYYDGASMGYSYDPNVSLYLPSDRIKVIWNEQTYILEAGPGMSGDSSDATYGAQFDDDDGSMDYTDYSFAVSSYHADFAFRIYSASNDSANIKIYAVSQVVVPGGANDR